MFAPATLVLSGLNPNVMYQLGLLYQAGKPTIILSDAETVAPFDVRSLMVDGQRTKRD
jgi:hypothetical protein